MSLHNQIDTYLPYLAGGSSSTATAVQDHEIQPDRMRPIWKEVSIVAGATTMAALALWGTLLSPKILSTSERPAVPAAHEIEVNKANRLLHTQIAKTVRNAVDLLQNPSNGGVYQKTSSGFNWGNRKLGTTDDPAATLAEIDIHYSRAANEIYLASSRKTLPPPSGSKYSRYTKQWVTITPDKALHDPAGITQMLDEGAYTIESAAAEYPDERTRVSTIVNRDAATGEWTLAVGKDSNLSVVYGPIEDLEVLSKRGSFDELDLVNERDSTYGSVAAKVHEIIDRADNNTTGR